MNNKFRIRRIKFLALVTLLFLAGWSPAQGKNLKVDRPSRPTKFRFSDDGQYFLTVHSNRLVRVWNAKYLQPIAAFDNFRMAPVDAVFCPGSTCIRTLGFF